MSEAIICRLCINDCDDYICLYEVNGEPSEVYELMVHYFTPEMLSVEHADHHKVICMECWDHIHEFHTFQVSIIQSQSKLLKNVKNSTEESQVKNENNDTDGIESIYMELIEEIKSPDDVIETLNHENKPLNCKTCAEVEIDVVSEDVATALTNTSIEKFNYSDDNNDDMDKNDEMVKEEIAAQHISAQELPCINGDAQHISQELPSNNGNVSADYNESTCEPKRKRKKENNAALEGDISLDYCPGSGPMGKNSKNKSNAEKNKESDDIIAQWLPNLECILCHVSFPTFTLLKDHFRQMHAKGKFSVVCCERNYTYRCQLEEHVRLHLDPDTFTCKVCYKRFSSKANLCSHKQSQCIPNKTNEKKSTEDSDSLIAKWRPKLTCELCNDACSSFSLLKKHFRQNHPNDDFYILCCARKFSFRCQIEEHASLHIDSNVFKCDLCGNCFTTKNTLNMHKRTTHNDEDILTQTDNTKSTDKQSGRKSFRELDAVIAKWRPILECVVCKESCSSFTQLCHHFRLKHKKDQLFVECCERKFMYRNHLEEHASLHLNPDNFKCEECGKEFVKRRRLQAHKQLEHPVFETILLPVVE